MTKSVRKMKQPTMREIVLNDGLDLAMAFGTNWLMPIQARLAKKHPLLSESELDEYNKICQEAMKFGHQKSSKVFGVKDPKTRMSNFWEQYNNKYPWVNEENVLRLYSQGMYYSMK